jgi:hypothetical protein
MDNLTDLLRQAAQPAAVFLSAFKARYGFTEVDLDDRCESVYACAADHAYSVLILYGELTELTAEEKALVDWWQERDRKHFPFLYDADKRS